MPNHFHLVLETPQPNLIAGMKWFLGTYTVRFNRRHKLNGHVFAGRYKSLLVGGQGGYLRTVCDYVHLNPVRAKLLPHDVLLRSYRWSSFPLFLAETKQRTDQANWLRVDRVFGECGIRQDTPAGRKEFERRLETRRLSETAEPAEELKAIRHGWCFGNDSFRTESLAQMEQRAGANHYGYELQEVAEEKANRILAEELGIAKWAESQLRALRKGHPRKIQIARRLRQETTVTLQWIATRLHMGTRGHLNHLLYWKRRTESEGADVSRRALAEKEELHKIQRGKQPDVRQRKQRGPTGQLVALRNASQRTQEGKQNPADDSIPLTDPADADNTIPLTDPDGFDTRFD
jgi:hypothetical protein